MADRKQILLISKPLCPPWNDSGKNLVRDLAYSLKGNAKYRFRILTYRKSNFIIPDTITERLYSYPGSFKPSIFQNLKVFARLLKPDPEVEIYHFFFAPNPVSCLAAKIILKLKRKKSIQTILSSPKSYRNIKKLIFADKVIVLSDYNKERLIEKGVANVVRIYPGVEISGDNYSSASEEEKLRQELGITGEKAVLFAGDYGHGDAPLFIKESIPKVLERMPRVKFIFSCRLKTPKAKSEEEKVKLEIKKAGVADSVIFLNEVRDIRQLIRVCDLAILPVNSLYAKMDIPLILLECLRERKPIVITDVFPLREILKDEAGFCVQFGNTAEFSEVIVKVLSDDKLREGMAKKAKAILEEHFDIRKIAQQYDKVYLQLLD